MRSLRWPRVTPICATRRSTSPTCRSGWIAKERAFPPGTSCFRARPRLIPGQHGTLRGCRSAAARDRGDGLRHPLYAAHSPHRHGFSQGQEQLHHRGARRPRKPLGHRRRADQGQRGRAQGDPSGPRARSTTSTTWSPAAREHGLELALDIAFQCSPDHPWVKEHPDWFIIRPDGTIQYAENPPKKYQDIYPLNFESSDWRGLWDELYSVFEFWIKRGVKVFRVDNPHTKALPFWEWCLATLREKYPDVIFLAEAFTRPHVMYSLAKGGFTQSYTYFTWRTTKAGAADLPRRDHAAAGQRLLPAELLAQHPGHPAQEPAGRRPAGVHAAPHPGRDADGELRHLWPRLRTRREHSRQARAGQDRVRRVHGQREV